MNQSDVMIWVDIESTGLNPNYDVPLEIGIVITDLDGNWKDEFQRPVCLPSWGTKLVNADPIVTEMHTESGLWQDLIDFSAGNESISMCLPHNVDEGIIKFFEYHELEGGIHPICGSTINFDRGFLEVYFPKTFEFFHYRNIDVSSVRGLCEKLNPELMAKFQGTKGNHRVINDIRASIDLYKFLKNEFLLTTR